MATLIPEVELSDFNSLKASDIKRLQCCEIYEDGEYLFTFIRPGTDFIRASAENSGLLSNSVAGEIPEVVIRQVITTKLDVRQDKTISDVKPAKRKYKKHKHRVKKIKV